MALQFKTMTMTELLNHKLCYLENILYVQNEINRRYCNGMDFCEIYKNEIFGNIDLMYDFNDELIRVIKLFKENNKPVEIDHYAYYEKLQQSLGKLYAIEEDIIY